jgi:hypothetical protein
VELWLSLPDGANRVLSGGGTARPVFTTCRQGGRQVIGSRMMNGQGMSASLIGARERPELVG